jgi:hypothetical protein
MGGMSTAPKTEEGERRLWEGHRRWRAEQRRLKESAAK